jgi:hypothetical protein
MGRLTFPLRPFSRLSNVELVEYLFLTLDYSNFPEDCEDCVVCKKSPLNTGKHDQFNRKVNHLNLTQ